MFVLFVECDKYLVEGDKVILVYWFDCLLMFVCVWEVICCIVIGVFNDGFIYVGNFVYLSLLMLFFFFIVMVVFVSLFGWSEDIVYVVNLLLVGLL